MPYQILWHMSGGLLLVDLIGDVTISDFLEINEGINNNLMPYESTDEAITLMINIYEATSLSTSLEELKGSQTYAYKKVLRAILIVGKNKTMRLTLLLIFGLAHPPVRLYTTTPDALATYYRMNK